MNQPLLEVRGLRLSFSRYRGGLSRAGLEVIRNLSLRVEAGQMVAVVGASGSGKSLLAHAILGILPRNAELGGEMLFRGEPLTQARREALRGREIALVPQSLSYLDPLMRMGPQMRKGRKDAASRRKSAEILRHYSLDPAVERRYPFELSGGMTRRILISTALVDAPALVIADEPTPGLDERLARRVVSHFRQIADEGAGVLLITHDLELAAETADRVVVFYAGGTVEDAPAADFMREETLRHPYSRALWRAMPKNGFQAAPGGQPYAGDLAALPGCAYAPRCELAGAACGGEIPWREARGGFVRCAHGEGVAK